MVLAWVAKHLLYQSVVATRMFMFLLNDTKLYLKKKRYQLAFCLRESFYMKKNLDTSEIYASE